MLPVPEYDEFGINTFNLGDDIHDRVALAKDRLNKCGQIKL